MKVNVAKTSGFCFGVKRAIDICLSLEEKRNVFVLGDIVHNKHVVKDLENKGIKRVKSIKESKNSVLIISAHGAPKKVFKKAKGLGYRIVDATCPKVKQIYKIAKELEAVDKIAIIGDRGHAEVKGIQGQLKSKAVVIESPNDPIIKTLNKDEMLAVITQSTQSIDNIKKTVSSIRKKVKTAKLYTTTCRITEEKQRELKRLAKRNDTVLIVGSPSSANTKRLYQLSKKINTSTYWIDSAKELKPSWFKRSKSVGIMAGASTPDIVVDAIVKVLS